MITAYYKKSSIIINNGIIIKKEDVYRVSLELASEVTGGVVKMILLIGSTLFRIRNSIPNMFLYSKHKLHRCFQKENNT